MRKKNIRPKSFSHRWYTGCLVRTIGRVGAAILGGAADNFRVTHFTMVYHAQ